MTISFYFDDANARSNILKSLNERPGTAQLLTRKRLSPWDGSLPERVGAYYYESPWILYSGLGNSLPVDLSAFDADKMKTPSQVAMALESLASTDWAIFSWGGYARYGMIGFLAPDTGTVEAPPPQGLFQYSSVEQFGTSYRATIGRRTRSAFAPLLWQILSGESIAPLVVTFEYYEEAFEGAQLNYSVAGEFKGARGESLSIYRILDFPTFEYFVGLINTVSVFDILPGTVDPNVCAEADRLANSLDLSGALQIAPWILICNGGEIDTNHVLFAARENSLVSRFIVEAAGVLGFAAYF